MNPIPYRIRLGVTGHRKLIQKVELKRQIISVLKDEISKLFDDKSLIYYKQLPDCQKTFSILTALAEGADRFVAKTVMEYDKKSTIEVVLPLTLFDYEETFINKDDPEFSNLLELSRNVIHIRKYDFKSDPKITSTHLEVPLDERITKARKDAYWKAGKYVVDHTDVLIALWNGKESNGKGGTKDVIDYAISKKRPVIIISTKPPFTITLVHGVGLNAEAIPLINEFNKLSIPPDEINQQVFFNKFLIEDDDLTSIGSGVSGQSYDPKFLLKEYILPYYLKSSKAAGKNKSRFKIGGSIIYLSSAIAVTAVILGVIYKSFLFYSYIIELICLIGVLFVYLSIQRISAHQKWLENRFITERLRSAGFFIIANLELPPIEIPTYMGLAHKSNDWMILVFTEIWNRLPKMQGIKQESLNWLKETICQKWIKKQMEHHGRNVKDLKKTSDRMKTACLVIFIIALIIPIIHIVKHIVDPTTSFFFFEKILIFFAITLPAIGVAIEGIRTSNEYVRIEKRSANMENVLNELLTEFNQVNDIKELEKLMYYTDEITLRENQDWLTLMKLKEITLV